MINANELQALKLALITDHGVSTRGMSEGAIIDKAFANGIINSVKYGDYTAAQTTAPAPVAPAPVAPASNSDAANQLAALIQQLTQSSAAPLDEARVISLIQSHSAAPVVTQIDLTKVDGAQSSNVVGVAHECFERSISHLTVGNQLYFYGRSGAGKSTTAKQLAAALDVPCFIMGAILSKFEVLGSLTPSKYLPSVVRSWLESDGGLLCIDEIDASCPRALVTIMAIFDHDGELTFPDGATFKRTDNHKLIVTANTTGAGASSEYNGRARLDAATLNRFIRIEHDYSDKIEKSLAPAQVVTYAQELREVLKQKGLHGSMITPRTIKQAGAIARSNLKPRIKREMIVDTFKQGLTDEQYKSAIGAIHSGIRADLDGALV